MQILIVDVKKKSTVRESKFINQICKLNYVSSIENKHVH